MLITFLPCFIYICFLSCDKGDAEEVEAVITRSTSERLESIATYLDDAPHFGNWEHLARALGVDRKTYIQFGTHPANNPTKQLFDHLRTSRPKLNVGELRKVIEEMKRKDILQIILKYRVKGKVID